MPLSQFPSSTSLQSIAHHHHTLQHSSQLPQVEYVLLAEFDIDQGSILKHHYPAPTGTDDHLLAEHMLPDGAHDRPEDWTVFYLNQVPALTTDPSLLAQADIKRKGRGLEGDAVGDQAPKKDDKAGLLYVMSLVRTKKDATVRRCVSLSFRRIRRP